MCDFLKKSGPRLEKCGPLCLIFWKKVDLNLENVDFYASFSEESGPLPALKKWTRCGSVDQESGGGTKSNEGCTIFFHSTQGAQNFVARVRGVGALIFVTLVNPIPGERGGIRLPPSKFLCLAQKPLYLTNRCLSTFPIHVSGLRLCTKKPFCIWGVRAPGSQSNAKI